MTVTEMIDNVEILLGDPNNYTWNANTQIRPALDVAIREIAMLIIGYSQQDRKALRLMDGIQITTSISIGSDGEDVSATLDTDSPMISVDGFISASHTSDSVEYDFVVKPPEHGDEMRNYYLTGTSSQPVMRFLAGNVYIDVDSNDYPVTTTFNYIKKPWAVVTDGAADGSVTTCELDVGLHDLVVEYAVGLLKRSIGDHQSYMTVKKEVERKLQQYIQGSLALSKEVGEVE
jgi:hypothetical protein